MRSGYVGLIGPPNVGKSTLLNQILKEKISITAPRPQTTRNKVLGILNDQDVQIIFVDTPGIIRAHDEFNKILVDAALATLSEMDIVCFLVDALKPNREAVGFVLENLKHLTAPIILAINKIDLVRDKRELLPLINEYDQAGSFLAIVPISALTRDGVDNLVGQIRQLLPEGPRYFPEDHLTDQPERVLVAELIREKVFHLLRQEVPYAVAVTVEKFSERPDQNRVDIEATIHVERNSQKGIIIGKQGQMLKEIGKQARSDIEALLGCHVFLGLFVRVQKDWRRDPRARSEFGYRHGR
jgi:GTP-binding protein Era